VIRRFLSQPTMKLLRQANADHPTPRAFHQHKASDDRSKHQANDQASNGSKRDGHGDTTSNRTKRLMATEPQTILRFGLSHGFTTWALDRCLPYMVFSAARTASERDQGFIARQGCRPVQLPSLPNGHQNGHELLDTEREVPVRNGTAKPNSLNDPTLACTHQHRQARPSTNFECGVVTHALQAMQLFRTFVFSY
jgi:hypothetical protein